MTRYEALEKLLELADEHHALGESGASYVMRNAKETYITAVLLNAIPELRSLLADVRERKATGTCIQANVRCNACGRSLVGVTTHNAGTDSQCKPHGYSCGLYGFISSPPSQQAVDVEGATTVEAAIDICHEFDINDSGRNIECIASIIRKHVGQPKEGYAIVPLDVAKIPHAAWDNAATAFRLADGPHGFYESCYAAYHAFLRSIGQEKPRE